MRRNQIRLLGILGWMFAYVMPWIDATAACTAANPSATVAESTPSADFVNNGDGTVTHSKTGLMWKQCAQGLSGAACATGTAATASWSAALKMAVTDTTGGYTDWRLPNTKELESIVETCGYGPAINQMLFPGTPIAQDFWSSSSYLGSTATAWGVAFNHGYDVADTKTIATNYVRLVRAVSAPDSFDAQNSTHTVTPSAGPNGTISPATPQTVTGGATASFTVTPNAGYTASVGGTCNGTLIGTSYTTQPVIADCTVTATFTALPTYLITPVVTPSGSGTLTCAPNPVTSGTSATCTAVAAAGYALGSIGGCGGSPGMANPYTTGAITAACTVTATFTANPVNGACGTANAMQSLFAPSANLCGAGSASAVNSAAGQYTWMCNGANGGGTSTCGASWASTPSGGRASASDSGAGCTSRSGNIAAATNVPSNLSFPEGAINFTLSGCTPGATANLTVQYTKAFPAGAQYYKESGTSWSTYPGATVSGNTITFSITDNGAQDSNPASGTITDPSGPAIVSAAPPPPTAVSAPMLSPVALIFLGGLIGMLGFVVPRRR